MTRSFASSIGIASARKSLTVSGVTSSGYSKLKVRIWIFNGFEAMPARLDSANSSSGAFKKLASIADCRDLCRAARHQVRNSPPQRPDQRIYPAEEVGFEPTEPCGSHAFQACRFGRSRTPPLLPDGPSDTRFDDAPMPAGVDPGGVKSPARVDRIASLAGTRGGLANLENQHLFWQVAVGSCATLAREPSQGRKAAALSGTEGVPQIAWPLLARTDADLSLPLPSEPSDPAGSPLTGWRRSSGWHKTGRLTW